MPDTTLSKASKCPKCNNVGDLILQKPTNDPRYTGNVYKCMYKLCLWYDTTWVVTVDEDGKGHMRDIGHTQKIYPALKKITDEQRRILRETFDDELT